MWLWPLHWTLGIPGSKARPGRLSLHRSPGLGGRGLGRRRQVFVASEAAQPRPSSTLPPPQNALSAQLPNWMPICPQALAQESSLQSFSCVLSPQGTWLPTLCDVHSAASTHLYEELWPNDLIFLSLMYSHVFLDPLLNDKPLKDRSYHSWPLYLKFSIDPNINFLVIIY